MYLCRVILILFVCCLVGTPLVEGARKKKRKTSRSTSSQQHEDVLHTHTPNPTMEEIHAALPHLKNKPLEKKEQSEDEKLKLNSKIPQLVEDVRFAVNNFGDVSMEKATALDKLGRVVFQLGKYEELLELSYEIVAIKEQLLGVDHVEVGAALRNIGTITGKLRLLDECRRVLLRALRIHKLHFRPGAREMAVLQAKMHQFGLGDEFLESEGTSFDEYMQEKKSDSSSSSSSPHREEEDDRAEL
jgi:hypothetical protein